MSIFPSSGTKLFIAPPGTIPFSPDLYVEVGEIADGGTFGRQYESIKANSLGNRGTRKAKGNYDDGTMSLTLNFDGEDLGQVQLDEAVDSDEYYQFKVVLNDARLPNTVGTTYTFEALVMGKPTVIGTSTGVLQATVSLEINSGSMEKTAAH